MFEEDLQWKYPRKAVISLTSKKLDPLENEMIHLKGLSLIKLKLKLKMSPETFSGRIQERL